MDALAYELLLDNLEDGVCFIDHHGKVVYWNEGAHHITGYAKEEVQGHSAAAGPLHHFRPDHGPQFDHDPFDEVLSNNHSIQTESWLKHRDGSMVPVMTRISPIRDSKGETIGVLEVFSDIRAKERHRIEELEEIALLCPLTEVGNRRYSEMSLNSAIEELTRYGWKFGLIFVDLDHFKSVNDIYGHKAGDEVLQMAAQALRSALRSFDFVGRWGGEEFIIILPNMSSELLRVVSERCRSVLAESTYQTEGRHAHITGSFGCTMAQAGDTAASLVERADRLMYQAKQHGRNQCCFEA